jgi:hypothetical protein
MFTIRPRPASIIIGAARNDAKAAALEHQIPVAPLHLPERRLEVERELVAAPRVVDEQVEPAVVVADPLEQRLDLRVVRVVAANGDACAAARGQLLRGVVDRAGTVERGRLAANGAAGDIDDRAFLAEDERDPLSAAAARTGDERDGSVQSRLGHS